MPFVRIQGHRTEYEFLGASRGAPVMVFLHEGLGSLSMWRDFPSRVAHATGCNALVYSRYGYGKSEPLSEPRATRFMHDEALKVLPELLDQLRVHRPILFGHSDGASIALIYAGGSGREVAGVVAMAPHVMVEEVCIRSIRQSKVSYETSDLREKLARYHADPDSAFRGWNDIWLHPEFLSWNIEEYLPSISCPILAIQGEDDEYGTMEQIERVAKQAADVDLVKLEDCRHSPQRDQPEAVVEAVVRFVDRIGGATGIQEHSGTS
jgi:pimeloyl-ACP methyl ester carboxylesterase